MSRYLNKINAGMYICDEYEEQNGRITKLIGIKNQLTLDSRNRADFSFICIFDFVEFEIPKEGGELSFRFYIRTMGETPAFMIPFVITEMGLKDDNEGVMTNQFPIMLDVKDYQFPRKGKFAIEVYKYFGKIDTRVEEENIDFYRKPENFVNGITFEVI